VCLCVSVCVCVCLCVSVCVYVSLCVYPGNFELSNLELLSRHDHRKIHAGWVREAGAWIRKPCKDCKKLLPLDYFYQRKGLTPSQRCIKCSSPYFKSKRTPKFIARRKEYMKKYYELNKVEKWGIKT